jgi:hypothetical protein
MRRALNAQSMRATSIKEKIHPVKITLVFFETPMGKCLFSMLEANHLSGSVIQINPQRQFDFPFLRSILSSKASYRF